MVDIIKRIQSLEDELKSLKPQVPEAKTTIKIVQMNEDWPKIAISCLLYTSDAADEDSPV